jgi:hypothetical protein
VSNPTITPTLINPYFGQDVPIDGGNQSSIAVLAGILIELRVQTRYLQAIAMGLNIGDDPDQLRKDEYGDTTFIRLS